MIALGIASQPRREMTVEQFRKIADDVFHRASALILTVGYEPLLSKSFVEILEIAGAYGIPKISYTTNATLLDSRMIEATIRCGVTEVIVSMDD